MERKLMSLGGALALFVLLVGVVGAQTVNHLKLDRSATSIGGSANPDSLGTTQEVFVKQLPTNVDGGLRLAVGATDSCKVTIQFCPHSIPAADTLWFTAFTDTVDSAAADTLDVPDTYRSWPYYRLLLDDIQGSALRVSIFEEYDLTRGGRGW
jgi:hypothetical protein